MQVTQSAPHAINSPEEQRSIACETIVVAGEFEVGKTSVVNAILRRELIPNDPGFLSRPLIRIRHHAQTVMVVELADGHSYEIAALEEVVERDDVVAVTIHTPMPDLEAVELVEVPFHPTNGFDPEHLDLMRSASLLVWVTIGSQAWRLSEKSIIEAMPEGMAERAVLAVSRADKFRSAADLDKIEGRLQREAAPFFKELVFMQASMSRLAACDSSDNAWGETGGMALVEIARDTIGDIDISDDELMDAFEAPKFGRRSTDLVDEDLPTAAPTQRPTPREAQEAQASDETEALEKFETWAAAELPEGASGQSSQDTSRAQFGRRGVAAAASGVAAQATSSEPTEDAVEREYDAALNELLLEVDDSSHATHDAEPALQHAPVQPQQTFEPKPEPDPEPVIPETPEEQLAREIAEFKGLDTAGVVDLKAEKLETCFAEHDLPAIACASAFASVIATIKVMATAVESENFQESTISTARHLILLKKVDGDRLGFFFLHREQANPAIASVYAKRLLDSWAAVSGDEA